MQYLDIDKDYDILLEGEIYEFNLDLLTKNLTLKVFIQIYDPKKDYTEEERKKVILRYYELKLIGIKKLKYFNFVLGPFISASLEEIGILKNKDNEYEVGIDGAGELTAICKECKLLELFESEMEHNKAFEF